MTGLIGREWKKERLNGVGGCGVWGVGWGGDGGGCSFYFCFGCNCGIVS